MSILSQADIQPKSPTAPHNAWEASPFAGEAGLRQLISEFSSPSIPVHPIAALMISCTCNFGH